VTVSETPFNEEGRYSATTRGITVSVEPQFVEEQSEPDARYFLWAYHVRIENKGGETVQLLTRHWRITDAAGQEQEVRGEGVVGKQPVLRPGQMFEYESGCPLSTSSGFMTGTYQMVSESGDFFDVEIPAFSLDTPNGTPSVH
jgi:ApaG protein